MSEVNEGTQAQAQPARRRRGCLLAAAIALAVVVLLACVLAGVMMAGGAKAKRELAAQYPPPGQMVDVGGYRLHLHCQGSRSGDDSPVVVVEAGMADFSVSWDQVQREVAQFARICTYDRAGLGWSDDSPNPRSAPYALAELQTLLTNAGEAPPYVLVGHSLGGVYVLLYAHEHPDQVAGLVLVDSALVDEDLRLPEAYLQAEERSGKQLMTVARLPQAMGAIGLLAQSPDDYPAGVLPPLPPGTEDTYKAVLAFDGSFFETLIAEYTSYEETKDLVRATPITLGDMPLIVLSAGQLEIPEEYGLSAEEVEEVYAARQELQAELAELSSNGQLVMAEESGHLVQIDQPELVIDALRQVVDAARR